MAKFDNRLDNIRVASPCKADWNEMYGDERKRFCADCKLSVYNLSGMTRRDAESLLIKSEGRLCVRYFRRADGTVLTSDCPVGWRAAKQRVSKVATAAFSMVTAMVAGVFTFNTLQGFAAFVSGPADLRSVGEVVPELHNDIAPLLEIEQPEEGWIEGRAIMGSLGSDEARYIYLKNSEGKGLRAK